ncbi:MAG: hypothetical protein ACYC9I_10460 [Desulfuromonadales bacterium]
MSKVNDDKATAVVTFVSGAIIGVAVTLLFVRMQRNRAVGSKITCEDYNYEGGDLFV